MKNWTAGAKYLHLLTSAREKHTPGKRKRDRVATNLKKMAGWASVDQPFQILLVLYETCEPGSNIEFRQRKWSADAFVGHIASTPSISEYGSGKHLVDFVQRLKPALAFRLVCQFQNSTLKKERDKKIWGKVEKGIWQGATNEVPSYITLNNRGTLKTAQMHVIMSMIKPQILH